jgi:hypothetical protein
MTGSNNWKKKEIERKVNLSGRHKEDYYLAGKSATILSVPNG